MGGGNFDSDSYTRTQQTRAAQGLTGVNGFTQRGLHAALDPMSVNNNGMHTGLNIRESLDSPEHPNSQAIAIMFDTTGSMRQIPAIFQEKLGDIYSLLLAKGYVEDPQVLIGAFDDAWVQRTAALQVSQFESDNRVDEAVRNVYLTGNGGGNQFESYALALYFIAFHTYIDCWEQRGQKGFLFLSGDETCEKVLSREHIKQWTGDDVAEDMPIETIMEKLTEKWDVWFLYPVGGGYSADMVIEGLGAPSRGVGWRSLLGDRALTLEAPETICDLIALIIGLELGTVTHDAGLDDLAGLGRDDKAIASVSKTLVLAGVGGSNAGGIVPLGTSDGDLPASTSDDGVDRL